MGRKRKTEKVDAKVMSEQRIGEEEPENRLVKISHYPGGNFRIGRRRKCIQRSTPDYQKVVPVSSSSQQRSKKNQNASAVLRKPLFSDVVDHCYGNIWKESPVERKNKFAYISCFWFSLYMMEHNRKKVSDWILRQDIFSKKYVFVPVLMWHHWSLVIFCHFGESLESESPTPCILLLDSLQTYGAPPRLEPIIRRLVMDLFEEGGRPESKDMIQLIPLVVPKVPQQRNGKECGIFVLYYTSLFLEKAPDNFSLSNGYPYFLKEDWFTEEELEGFYKRLEYLGIESGEPEEVVDSNDSEGFYLERIEKHE